MVQKKKTLENPFFVEFKRLENLVDENEYSSEFQNISKRDEYNQSQRYHNNFIKLKRLKESNPTAFHQYEEHKKQLAIKRERESQQFRETQRLLEQQELAKKKNAVLREVGLVHFGLNYDDYEKEQIKNEKEGRQWLALYEWIELKGHNLCIDKNGKDVCKK